MLPMTGAACLSVSVVPSGMAVEAGARWLTVVNPADGQASVEYQLERHRLVEFYRQAHRGTPRSSASLDYTPDSSENDFCRRELLKPVFPSCQLSCGDPIRTNRSIRAKRPILPRCPNVPILLLIPPGQ